MIGSALKKLARENNMRIDGGKAYGSLRGYSATMFEGAGYKQIIFTMHYSEIGGADRLKTLVEGKDIQKDFRVTQFTVAPDAVSVVFYDNPGTMKKINAFLDWFIPVLEESSACRSNVCSKCGGEITSEGKWVQTGVVVFHVHSSCAEIIETEVERENADKNESSELSYINGAIGALLGALVGALVWAVVLSFGYIASLVGLLIAWLANFGYNLTHGKNGKGKLAILIVTIVLGVLIGTLAGDALSVGQMINAGELPGFEVSDIPYIIYTIFVNDAEYRMGTLSNIGIGLLFAALGAFGIVKRTGNEVADVKFKVLDNV